MPVVQESLLHTPASKKGTPSGAAPAMPSFSDATVYRAPKDHFGGSTTTSTTTTPLLPPARHEAKKDEKGSSWTQIFSRGGAGVLSSTGGLDSTWGWTP